MPISSSFPTYSLRRQGIHTATVMLFPQPGGFCASLSTSFGFRNAEGCGETPVAALYALATNGIALGFAHEIKTQVIPRQIAN